MITTKLKPTSGGPSDIRSYMSFHEIKEKPKFLTRWMLKFLLKRGWACHKVDTSKESYRNLTRYYFDDRPQESLEEQALRQFKEIQEELNS